ncbi:hypothetical protein [Streptomyces sp. NPDC026589]|uniref:hypothetical protein n=1 Tax=Streptomyces sp. NPDC026589 TaxID=3155609 RepID=UPI0033F47DB1
MAAPLASLDLVLIATAVILVRTRQRLTDSLKAATTGWTVAREPHATAQFA